MKTLATCLTFTISLLATAAFGACEMPSLVSAIPDGATATEAELLAVQTEVTAYIAAMDEYIACQNEELTTNGEDAAKEYLYQIGMRIAFAREEVDAVATNFNEQVNAFRAARQAAPGVQ